MRHARGIAEGDHAALVVRPEKALIRGVCAMIPHQRFIRTRAVHIALGHSACAVVLPDQVGAVIEEGEIAAPAIDRIFRQPAFRVVDQLQIDPAACGLSYCPVVARRAIGADRGDELRLQSP